MVALSKTVALLAVDSFRAEKTSLIAFVGAGTRAVCCELSKGERAARVPEWLPMFFCRY